MKINYNKEDDILVVELSDQPYDYAEMQGDFIVHFAEDNKPVMIEVLDASQFFKQESLALPQDIKEKYFAKA